MATATAPAVTRETLEDRYSGLTWQMSADGEEIVYTELQSQLSDALRHLVTGTARCHADDGAGIVDDLYTMIRTKIIDGVLADGVADPEPWSHDKAAES